MTSNRIPLDDLMVAAVILMQYQGFLNRLCQNCAKTLLIRAVGEIKTDGRFGIERRAWKADVLVRLNSRSRSVIFGLFQSNFGPIQGRDK